MRHYAMAVCASNVALVYLLLKFLQANPTPNHLANLLVLLAANMVEVQDSDVAHPAINARVLFQMIYNILPVSYDSLVAEDSGPLVNCLLVLVVVPVVVLSFILCTSYRIFASEGSHGGAHENRTRLYIGYKPTSDHQPAAPYVCWVSCSCCLSKWCYRTDSNCRRRRLQLRALPTELP